MTCGHYRRTVEPLPNRKRFATRLPHKVRQSLGHAKPSRLRAKSSLCSRKVNSRELNKAFRVLLFARSDRMEVVDGLTKPALGPASPEVPKAKRLKALEPIACWVFSYNTCMASQGTNRGLTQASQPELGGNPVSLRAPNRPLSGSVAFLGHLGLNAVQKSKGKAKNPLNGARQ
jgi:hypothetical protein